MTFRRQFDREGEAEMSRRTALVVEGTSLVQQQFKDDADINVLVRRFGVDKQPIPPAVFDPRYYGDVTDAHDLGDALRRVREAEERFQALPAALRRRFANSPAELWAFVNDPANVDEAVQLGLLKRLGGATTGDQPKGAPNTPLPSSSPSTGAPTASAEAGS